VWVSLRCIDAGRAQELVTDLFQRVRLPLVEIDDLGSLENELDEYTRRSLRVLSRPLTKAILPDIYAEMTRDIELAELIKSTLQEPKRVRAKAILERAINRGELAVAIDRARPDTLVVCGGERFPTLLRYSAARQDLEWPSFSEREQQG
jgi:hypothetical protein